MSDEPTETKYQCPECNDAFMLLQQGGAYIWLQCPECDHVIHPIPTEIWEQIGEESDTNG